ncbi:hypothetical protein DJ031_05950 [bacterium endosymbiont of Escarpia laminata]|nr:MAG: hypothetical protein DJ031_05950 [bacterium endosymbiont of Escarpia laminata]
MMKVQTNINRRKGSRMQLKAILNRIQKFKSFVDGTVHWVKDAKGPTVEVDLHHRRNNRLI